MSHAKLRPIHGSSKDKSVHVHGGHLHYCPGCKAVHIIPSTWDFNGNYHLPTFTPSVKHQWGDQRVCHYNLVNGELDYGADCTHELRGQKIALPNIPEQYKSYL